MVVSALRSVQGRQATALPDVPFQMLTSQALDARRVAADLARPGLVADDAG
jgi:hypothetical protein